MARTEALGLRVEPDTKAALERAAAAEERSLSFMAEKALRAWLGEHGFLEAGEGRPQSGRNRT